MRLTATETLSMHRSIELSLELTAQELLAPPTVTASIEVEDIDSIEPIIAATTANAANNEHAPYDEEAVELELKAEEIDAFLEGRLTL
jgi:hypothetical protein